MSEDTIAAVATAVGAASLAVIRVSGPEAVAVVDRVFQGSRPLRSVPSHTVWYGYITRLDGGQTLDEVLVTVMLAPRTYTTEDVVEIGTHGGLQTVNAVLSEILRSGARLADAGEFTKRAFLGGRIDLAQAEGVMELIQAQSEGGRRAALDQVQGSLTRGVRGLRQQLLQAMAHIEVTIDYPEHDVEMATTQEVARVAREVRHGVDSLLRTAASGRILRDGIRTVIVGLPNVGKSSLLNELVRSERAIVTDIPGTTRDVLEERVELAGIPLRLLDTAGIRETEDRVERLGVERSRAAMKDAEVIVLVVDGSRELTLADRKLLVELQGRAALVLLSKADLGRGVSVPQIREYLPEDRIIPYSIYESNLRSKLEDAFRGVIYSGAVAVSDATFVANARHMALLDRARRQLDDTIDAAVAGVTLDLVAVDLREAWRSLGEIIGETPQEDLLDQIFSQFCLGK